MSEAARFIIITTPPPDVAERIDMARRRVCTIGHARAALAYPPHVTLRTGALVPAPLVSTFINGFEAVVDGWDPFAIRTDGLWRTAYRDRGEEKFLVGYRIVKDPPLAALNARLLGYTTWRASDRLHFEPHLTLAFDDLDLDGFVRVEHWLDENPDSLPKEFTWICDNVGLFRREEDTWTAHKVWRTCSSRGRTSF
jgi:2'-5' RNA ligase